MPDRRRAIPVVLLVLDLHRPLLSIDVSQVIGVPCRITATPNRRHFGCTGTCLDHDLKEELVPKCWIGNLRQHVVHLLPLWEADTLSLLRRLDGLGLPGPDFCLVRGSLIGIAA